MVSELGNVYLKEIWDKEKTLNTVLNSNKDNPSPEIFHFNSS